MIFMVVDVMDKSCNGEVVEASNVHRVPRFEESHGRSGCCSA